VLPQLRPAAFKDRKPVFDLHNRPELLKFGTIKSVPWPDHMKWFDEALSGNPLLFIVELEDKMVGVVCLTRRALLCAEATVYLDPEFQGKGYGTHAIEQGVILAHHRWTGVREVFARILPTNEPSLKAFRKAKFFEFPHDLGLGLSGLKVLSRLL